MYAWKAHFSPGTNGEDANNRRAQGFDMISITTDVGVLAEGMMRELGVAKSEKPDTTPRRGY
jgi:4-hydroxy-2-oxoheptanedioate aldolase